MAKSNNKQPRPITVAAMRAAVAAGQKLAAARNGTLAVGIGHKRTRGYARAGFGHTLRIAVKFLVRFKRDRPHPKEKIPKRVVFQYRNKRYSLPSDVVAVGKLARHQSLSPPLAMMTNGADFGSCGFLAQDSSGVRYLVTAGHLLSGGLIGTPVEVGSGLDGSDDILNGARIGTVAMLPSFSNGQFEDVGVVQLDQNNGLQLPQNPWFSITSVLGEDDLLSRVKSGTVNFQAAGAKDAPSGIVETVLINGKDMVSLNPPTYYAPVIVQVTATSGIFQGGDSGSPLLTTDDKALIGIHVVGDADGGTEGFAILGATALQLVQSAIAGLQPILSS
jgi:hypothetical protein